MLNYMLNTLSSVLKYRLMCTIMQVHAYNKSYVYTKDIIERSCMDPQQARNVMGNWRATYSIVQSRRSGDPRVCIPNQEVSTVKPKKAVGQKVACWPQRTATTGRR